MLLQESFGCQGLEIVELGQGVEIRSGKGARGPHASCQVGVGCKGIPGRGPLKIKLARIHHREANLGIKIKLESYDCSNIAEAIYLFWSWEGNTHGVKKDWVERPCWLMPRPGL